jgi:hypothetical protein
MVEIFKISHAVIVDAEGWLIVVLIKWLWEAHALQVKKIGAHDLKQTSISQRSESISHFINTIL